MAQRRDALIVIALLALIALLMRLGFHVEESPPAKAPDRMSMWGIRLGMTQSEVLEAFGRNPSSRFCDHWVFGRTFGAEDAVVSFDRQGRVRWVRGSAVEIDGKRVPLPIDQEQIAKLFGDPIRSSRSEIVPMIPEHEQVYFTQLQLGLQLRSVWAVKRDSAFSRITHATCAWLGPSDALIYAVP